MTVNWSQVTVDHVREACKLVDGGHVNLKRAARSTFLRFGDRVYPAKFVRGLAYFLATGVELDPNNDYAGGKETVRFFQKLGLQASNRGEWANSVPTPIPVKVPKVALRTPTNGRKYEPQKRALLGVLQKRFGTVTCEAAFSWLTVPDRGDLDDSLVAILQSLESLRGLSNFLGTGRSLYCDFVLPSERIIVEYDERQHFTLQRQKALELYPPDMELGFDRHEWITSCALIKATDSSPPFRDERRAFYDSLRDISAVRNGYQIVRIRQGVVDWTSNEAEGALDAVISPAVIRPTSVATPKADMETSKLRRIALISHDYGVRDTRGLFDYSEHFSRINVTTQPDFRQPNWIQPKVG